MRILRKIIAFVYSVPLYTMSLRDASYGDIGKDPSYELARRFFRYKLYLAKKDLKS
jgi:hypothetical protein